ncbi:MAG: geranylgeranylglyceryl/heptaprenylglyceryl phosphate synthase, partial [Candidatus Odinarchaeia archaeon]
DTIKKDGAVHLTLIDPDYTRQTPEEAGVIAELAVKAGTDAIMVGGSTALEIDTTVKAIKEKSKSREVFKT